MSDTTGPGVWEIYREAETAIAKPTASSYTDYIAGMMAECVRLGTQYGRSRSALGNMKGQWFELLCKTIFESELGEGNITMRVDDRKNHKIAELDGFKHVTWITYPDAIVINEQRLKAVISIKWGMRHDRMYEPLYAALAMKDVLKEQNRSLNFYLLTNDNSPSRLRVMLEAPMLDGVYHIDPDSIQSHNDQQSNVLRRLKSFEDILGQLRLLVS